FVKYKRQIPVTKAILPDTKAAYWPCGVLASGRTLHRLATGQWQLCQRDFSPLITGSIQALWQCPWWLTLRLAGDSHPQSYEITVWRHRVDNTQWRRLRVFASNELVFANRRVGRQS